MLSLEVLGGLGYGQNAEGGDEGGHQSLQANLVSLCVDTQI